MERRHKVLLVDDDPALLETYSGLLSQLPSQPEIQTATSGSRAMAMLEDEPYRLLICDLRMPKMDGLQVLSIVRSKYPHVRTVALTAVPDEQFRSRVYALGVDLFWHKPSSEQEIRLFLECLESLLGQDPDNGFRGVQNKSLVDLIQLECVSQSSSVLRIRNGSHTGQVWILNGEVIDAEAGELKGEDAFRKIFGWEAGTFEVLQAEPEHPRAIFKNYSGLLLESAQAVDEARSQQDETGGKKDSPDRSKWSQIEGMDFLLARKNGGSHQQVTRGIENPERVGAWAKQSVDRFRSLGDRLHAGPLEEIAGVASQHKITLTHQADTLFCVGWKEGLSSERIRELTKKLHTVWVS